MADGVRFLAGVLGASLVMLSLGRCTLLVGELPDPLEETPSDGGQAGADDGAIASGGSGATSAGTSGRSETGGEDGAGGDDGRGGTASGGAATGGNPSGGTSSGGTSSGGVTTGGVMTGGVMTGGNPSGGVTAGGGAAGGVMTGGTATGGRSSGGAGGTASGGTSGSAAGTGAASGGGRGGAPVDCDRDDDNFQGAGATCGATDCDDGDSDAHPGQQGFFVDPRASGGYDYDCNGRSERQFETGLDCGLLAVASCSGEGFAGSPPVCGAQGAWIRCVLTVPPLALLCTSESQGMRRMACR
ncbi:MAG TPA: hypothetical protein VF103_13580 [Polyangiaceae bacterium]